MSKNSILIKRHQEKETKEKKERTRGGKTQRVRQRYRRKERERKRESVCVGLLIIITHVYVRVTIFATKDTVIIFSISIFPTDQVADKVGISARLLAVRMHFR